jgi:hypothetical protein
MILFNGNCLPNYSKFLVIWYQNIWKSHATNKENLPFFTKVPSKTNLQHAYVHPPNKQFFQVPLATLSIILSHTAAITVR